MSRTETDSLGAMEVPDDALYGAQTQRAVLNFPISGQRMPRSFLAALGLVKRSAARVNRRLGELDDDVAQAIEDAAEALVRGELDAHFPVDIYQTGSGTSTNMNANEVLANRASVALGAAIGSKRVHPNDHVNHGQSSNDVIPTTLHVAAAVAVSERLLPAIDTLAASLEAKASAWADVVKSGRTHLMDATPVTLGQEFGGYARQLRKGARRVAQGRDALLELAIGGTAVGTGINSSRAFAEGVVSELSAATGLAFVEAADHFEAQGARDDAVELMGQLNTLAVSLMKIANDIRWLGSGPRAGLGELRLPAIQPGSSIMPGKVNPVLCEMLTQVCARVMGHQTTVTVAGMSGALELNVFIPVIAASLLESIELLANACRVFATDCVDGIAADEAACRASVERNLSLGTALNPLIGYDAAAKLVKRAHREGRNIREVAEDEGVDTSGLDALALTRRD